MSAHILINPESGALKGRSTDWLETRIAREVAAAGYTPVFTEGAAPDLMAAAARIVKTGGADCVVTVGGDGTVAAICQELSGSGVPLAPLPGGTANLFAQDIGLPNDLDAALTVALLGEPKPVDIGFVNERAFLNNVVFGAYADLAAARELLREADDAVTAFGALSEIGEAVAGVAPKRYRISSPSFEAELETNTLMVSNNIYTGAELLRPVRGRIDRGVLGVYLAESGSRRELAMRIAEVAAGRAADSPGFSIRETHECRISAVEPPLDLAIDGESVTLDKPAVFAVAPKAVTVLCPATPL